MKLLLGVIFLLKIFAIEKGHAAQKVNPSEYPNRHSTFPDRWQKGESHFKNHAPPVADAVFYFGHNPKHVPRFDYEAEYNHPCNYQLYTHHSQGTGWRHRTQHMETFKFYYDKIKSHYSDLGSEDAKREFVQNICYTSYDFKGGPFSCHHSSQRCVCRDDDVGRAIWDTNTKRCIYGACRYCFDKYGPIPCKSNQKCLLYNERNFFRCIPKNFPPKQVSDYYCPPESPEPPPTAPPVTPPPVTPRPPPVTPKPNPTTPRPNPTTPKPGPTTPKPGPTTPKPGPGPSPPVSPPSPSPPTTPPTTKPPRASTKYPPISRWKPC